MRTLLLTRGAPGAGKSTWIKNNHLENYVLSPDNIRLLYGSLSLQPDGTNVVSQENDTAVWKTLFAILENRMQNGEFTVIDATCSKTKDMQKFKKLCQDNRYRIFCVDFTQVPLDICLKQNQMRPREKWVPDDAIKNIYARFATQQVPSGITVIKPDELNTIFEKPIDLSEYKKVVMIGDIHGCYSTLMKYFDNNFHDDYCYIFAGDYLDRGYENAEVFKFLYSIMEKPNVCLLEGNHENHIKHYGMEAAAKSDEFELRTKPQLIAAGITSKEARIFYRKLRQMSHFIYHDKEVLVCHGGIPHMNTNLLFVPTKKFIKGAGSYPDYDINASTWMGQTKDNQYLVHGHRNTNLDEIQMADRVFNLEGSVEYGGELRIVELDETGWHPVYVENVQPAIRANDTTKVEEMTIENAVKILRDSKFVSEKKLGNDISAFNFTREAFFKSNWNTQTILARGLFINTKLNEITARSYEKFFRIGETSLTEMSALKLKLQFPVRAYRKENGFLAIVSYDPETEDLFVASKSTNKGDYVEYIKNQLSKYWVNIKEYLKDKHQTMVFECIDIEHDPHIIKYPENKLVLLDIINNDLKFSKVPYEDLCKIADSLNIEHKQLAYELKNWDEFRDLVNDVDNMDYKYNNEYIEGYVFEDINGFMVKVKSAYYNQWKKLRGVSQQTLHSGYIRKTSMLTNELENYFYGFCRELYKNKYSGKDDIISIRDLFQNQ